MSQIQIVPVDETHTVTQIYINNIFVDIQNQSVTIEVRKQDVNGMVIEQLSLIASGTDYTDIYDQDMMIDFVLTQLNFTPT